MVEAFFLEFIFSKSEEWLGSTLVLGFEGVFPQRLTEGLNVTFKISGKETSRKEFPLAVR
jgi:hypothetical protein